jgi:NADH-quinone oxidoreductase subunit J
MDYIEILFYVFAALAVGASVIVVFSRSVIYAAFSLMFTFLGVAGLYVLLLADFVAISQVLIYVGGILVLLIFGVMLTRDITNVDLGSTTMRGLPASIIVGVFLGTMILLVTKTTWTQTVTPSVPENTTQAIGEQLLSTYLLPFEVAAILLLVAVMGAAMIARKQGTSGGNA